MQARSHSAPGASAGFGYQFERALYWLAQSPAGASVGIETDDDVAVRTGNSSLLEQDKHSIRSAAEPFGDRSKDLWKTLVIWMDAAEEGRINIDTTRFLMVTNKTIPECIAKKISNAQQIGDVEDCISDLERAAENPPEGIANLTDRALRSESRETLRLIIPRIELVDASCDTAAPALRQQTIAHLQLPSWCITGADSVANELLGWLHSTAMTAWQQQTPAWVQRDHFVNQLHAILNLRKRQVVRERAEHLIPVADDVVGGEKGRPFVKQMYLVTEDDSLVDTSIREFIRCNIEKIRLSKEGNVTDEDWTTFESVLSARWEKIRARVIRMRKETDEKDVGFEILTETTEDHREKLAGSDTEQIYLTAGTYHRLADLLRLGWHPRFSTLMKES